MAEIIINTKEVIKRKSYYPDFINIIINKAFNNIRKDIYNNSTNITEITTIDILINN